ncbi:DUF4386 domain-containing protein [soil metagenome]
MTMPNAIASPQNYARFAGIIYLLLIIAGGLDETLIRNTIIALGDPLATANNITAHESLWRLGIAGDLLMHVCDVFAMLALYVLLKPVNRKLALMALIFNVVQTAVLVANKLTLLLPLLLIGDASYLKAFDPAQLQALSYLAIRLHGYGFGVGLIFFGVVCLLEGYLIIKSRFLPCLLGTMMQVAGVCYLANSFLLLLAPQYASLYIMLPCLFAELSFALWLLFKGVDVTEWQRQAALST